MLYCPNKLWVYSPLRVGRKLARLTRRGTIQHRVTPLELPHQAAVLILSASSLPFLLLVNPNESELSDKEAKEAVADIASSKEVATKADIERVEAKIVGVEAKITSLQ